MITLSTGGNAVAYGTLNVTKSTVLVTVEPPAVSNDCNVTWPLYVNAFTAIPVAPILYTGLGSMLR